jgi:hypothetical protein
MGNNSKSTIQFIIISTNQRHKIFVWKKTVLSPKDRNQIDDELLISAVVGGNCGWYLKTPRKLSSWF